jgi:ADP-ribose pyrophosphatase YjhB (NUDIX family)
MERLPSSNPRLVSLAVIQDDARRVLLVRSARRPDRWELPGGAVELDESPWNAARREVLEETGFDVEDLRLIGLYWGRRDRVLRLVFHAAARTQGTPQPRDAKEIREASWFADRELPHPMPAIAMQMIHDAGRGDVHLRSVVDDRELI